VRPFVTVVGGAEEAPALASTWSAAIVLHLGEAAEVTTTVAGDCITLVASNLALPSMADVVLLNAIALGVGERVIRTNMVLVIGQAPLGGGARYLRGTASLEDAWISPPSGCAILDSSRLRAAFTDVERAAATEGCDLVRWDDAYLASIQAAIPDGMSENLLVQLLMREIEPGDLNTLRKRRVAELVAKALWTTCAPAGDDDAMRTFISWATEDGYNSNVRERMERIWTEATGNMQTDAGVGDGQVTRDLLSHLRDSAPHVHAAWVARNINAAAGLQPVGSLPPWLHWQTKEAAPGRQAIGSLWELMRSHKYVGLQAPAGFGKTEAMKATLREQFPRSFLIITTRTSVAAEFQTKFNPEDDPFPSRIFHYSTDFDAANERGDVDFLICELESLPSLRRDYDVVFADEFMTILLQTAAGMNRNKYTKLCGALQRLFKAAKHVVFADALLTTDAFRKVVEIVEGRQHGETAAYLRYMSSVPPTQSVEVTAAAGTTFKREDIDGAFASRFEAGERTLFVFTNIKKLVSQIEASYTKQWRILNGGGTSGGGGPGDGASSDGESDDGASGGSGAPPMILILSKETYHAELKKSNGKTVDDWWRQYDLVIVTPTVTNAISFDVPDHFHAVLAFLSNWSCGPPDAFQGCRRVRHSVSGVIRVYLCCGSVGGDVAAVKEHTELVKEAGLRHNRATDLEKFCYATATRARLLSFHFYERYLRACFESNGLKVNESSTALTGTSALAEAPSRAAPPYSETRRVTEEQWKQYIRDMSSKLAATEAVTALEACGINSHVHDALRTMDEVHMRFVFAVKLLAVENPLPSEHIKPLTDAEHKAVESLWAAFYTDDAKRAKYWAARNAFLYERYRDAGLDVPDAYNDNALQPWSKRFRVVRKALNAVGLRSAVPKGSSVIERAVMESAHADLCSLVKDADVQLNTTFGSATAPIAPEKVVRDSVRILKAILKKWNPFLTIKVSPSRKRTRGGDTRAECNPYQLTWVKDSNIRGEMTILHDLNLRVL